MDLVKYRSHLYTFAEEVLMFEASLKMSTQGLPISTIISSAKSFEEYVFTEDVLTEDDILGKLETLTLAFEYHKNHVVMEGEETSLVVSVIDVAGEIWQYFILD